MFHDFFHLAALAEMLGSMASLFKSRNLGDVVPTRFTAAVAVPASLKPFDLAQLRFTYGIMMPMLLLLLMLSSFGAYEKSMGQTSIGTFF